MHVAVASDHTPSKTWAPATRLRSTIRTLRKFVGAKLSQEERHLRRLAKIDAIEERCGLEFLNNGATPADLGI